MISSPDRLALFVAALLGATTPAVAAERSFQLSIDGSRVTGDGVTLRGRTSTLRVTKGDRVELRWSSTTALTLHLHGYDRMVNIPAGGTARMVLDAQAAGRFPIAVHEDRTNGHGHLTLLYLEVTPP